MVSLDRVGVGAVVPVSSATAGGDPAQRRVLATAARAGVPVVAEENRSSDHWSFVRTGLPGVRLGSTPDPGYHSAADVPAVVDPAQLARTGRLLLAWLR
jgi:Zn-dependent M28 family amino/carboxypeptidase